MFYGDPVNDFKIFVEEGNLMLETVCGTFNIFSIPDKSVFEHYLPYLIKQFLLSNKSNLYIDKDNNNKWKKVNAEILSTKYEEIFNINKKFVETLNSTCENHQEIQNNKISFSCIFGLVHLLCTF